MKVISRFIKVLFFSVTTLVSLTAQNFKPTFIPFEVDGIALENPLIGGLIAPQFVSFDLDGQGAEDLIVFERNGDVLLPFLNFSTPGNPDYRYAPEYTTRFPKLIKFVKFLDFNGDGKKDIFAFSPMGPASEVYRNTSDGEISFELMNFNFGAGNFIQIPAGNGFTNLFISSIDIPAIIDTDNDGDLDILTFETGGSYMYLYQNMVKEQGLPDDTLVYRTVDQCWGNFFESGVDEAISLSDDRDDCSSGLLDGGSPPVRHAGSTVTAFDGDGDGDLDMLLGDISNNGLVYLENDEQDGDAFIISQDLNFPANSEEANITVFLGSFFIDVDNDGKRDLIVCPNNELGSDNINHIWYYNNVGEDNAPVFELVQKDFLHETTLRMGHSSHPTFLDYNEDGLTDLLVGMNYVFSEGEASSISLFLYENIGSLSEPSYRLVNDDYLGLSSDLNSSYGFLAPAAGDLDNDGDTDIIISDNRSNIFYFENEAGPNQPYEFNGYIYEYQGLKVGSNGKPQIIDLDGDGLSDIVMGEKRDNGTPATGEAGGVNFYKNIGSVGNPLFDEDETVFPNTDILGRIYTKRNSDISGGSSPYFFYIEGELNVAVGSRSGRVYHYDNITDNVYGEFNLLTDSLPILNSGRRTSVALEDLDNDGFHEMIVGNDSGGLMAFNTTFYKRDPVSTKEIEEAPIIIVPNPAQDYIRVVSENLSSGKFSILDVEGKTMMQGNSDKLSSSYDISLLPSGVYILRIQTEEGTSVEKFVKL